MARARPAASRRSDPEPADNHPPHASDSTYTDRCGRDDNPPCQTPPISPDQPAHHEIDQIAEQLAQLARTGQLLPGSLQQRHTRCGKPGCACQADPPRPHGPYWQWTRKVAGKTITRRLSAQQIDRYQPWIDNDRRLHQLLTRLEQLTIDRVEADQHT